MELAERLVQVAKATQRPDPRANWQRRSSYLGKQNPAYECWHAMKQRCLNPGNSNYPYYGGRGIRVCARWLAFDAFLEDMGPRPSPHHCLCRLDNDGDYEPGNVEWGLKADNSREVAVRIKSELDGRFAATVPSSVASRTLH